MNARILHDPAGKPKTLQAQLAVYLPKLKEALVPWFYTKPSLL